MPSERRVQILTSGLPVGSQGEATLIYRFSCCLKSPYGEDTKGCCHLKLVSCSHIKLPFKTGEGFCFLLSHFLRSPSQRCSRSLFYMDFLNGFLVFLPCFCCGAYLSAGFFLLLAQEHWGSELDTEYCLIKLLRREAKMAIISTSSPFSWLELRLSKALPCVPWVCQPANHLQMWGRLLCSHHFVAVQIRGWLKHEESQTICCDYKNA